MKLTESQLSAIDALISTDGKTSASYKFIAVSPNSDTALVTLVNKLISVISSFDDLTETTFRDSAMDKPKSFWFSPETGLGYGSSFNHQLPFVRHYKPGYHPDCMLNLQTSLDNLLTDLGL